MRTLMRLCMIACLFLVSAQTHAGLVVIVNAKSTITSLDRDQVSRIFMKKLKVMPDGSEVIPVGQLSSPKVDQEFYLAVCNKDRSQLSAYWARLMFTGKDRPPIDGKNDEGVIAIVTKDARAVGFVNEASVTPAVRVVYRVQ
jgi:ABC-type phosphate transport system substrate-binding protein